VVRLDQRGRVRRLALAAGISRTGSLAADTALAFLIFHRTGKSPVWVSAVLLVGIGGQALFMPLGGFLGDRFDRRRVLIASDLLGAAVFLVFPFVTTPAGMVAVALLAAMLAAPVFPVAGASIPNLIEDPQQFSWANGTLSAARTFGILVGPMLGGGLIALLAGNASLDALRSAGFAVFWLNALSFVGSAWLVSTIHARFGGGERGEQGEQPSVRARDGFAFVLRDPVIRSITAGWTLILLGSGGALVAEVSLADYFHTGSLGYGSITAAVGAGVTIGALLARRVLNERREPWGMIVGVCGVAVGFGAVSIAPWFAFALLVLVVFGLGEGVSLVAEQGIMQRRTPDALRARVISASEAPIQLGFALSIAAGGFLVRAVGPKGAYGVACGAAFLGLLVFLPAIRGLVSSERVVVIPEAQAAGQEVVVVDETIGTPEP
jgi:MFS transporter, ENTS family, enterobactin (siderophore) exporter